MAQREDIGRLYESHAKTVYSFLCRLCRDADLAQELTQETFLRAMDSIERFDEQCKMTTWLCQIAKNLFYDHLKYTRRHPKEPMPEQEPPAAERPLEEILCDADIARQIRAIVHGLAEPYKEVFLMRVYAELSFREISLLFEKSEVWGRVTFLRAKEMVLRQLERTEQSGKEGVSK